MKLFNSFLLIFSIQYANARTAKRPQNKRAVIAAYQNFLSPENSERAIQLMQMGKSPVIEENPVSGFNNIALGPILNQLKPCQQAVSEVAPNVASNLAPNFAANLAPNLAANLAPNLAASLAPNRAECPCQRQPEVIHVPVPYPVPVKEQSSPSLPNPFLPAASPISAWAPPNSGMLPPVVPGQSRNHFLRKIPIPPPTL